jgi:hypothetical protein
MDAVATTTSKSGTILPRTFVVMDAVATTTSKSDTMLPRTFVVMDAVATTKFRHNIAKNICCY